MKQNNLFALYKENAHIVFRFFGIKMTFKYFLTNQLEDCCCIANLEYFKSQGTKFMHPVGVCIHKNVKIGKNCTIYQNVTIGRGGVHKDAVPELGNNVTVYANSVIFGKIKIGDNAKIGAGSVVFHDVPANTIVAGNPAKIIKTFT